MAILSRFLLGAGLSVLFAGLAIRWLGSKGFMDVPSGRRRHEKPVPRVGGIALAATLLVAFTIDPGRFPLTGLEKSALFAMAMLGILDDRLQLRARWKAIFGLVLALVLAVVGAARLAGSTTELSLLGLQIPHSFAVLAMLLVVYYWSLPQALNLVDGANGLALGYSIVLLGSLALAGAPRPLLSGALLGLLMLNWPRARLFLGDSGSLVLGLLLALLVKKHVAYQDPNLLLWAFAYPSLDVVLVICIRLMRRQNLGMGDRSHLHYQWLDRFPRVNGWVVPLLWLHAAACSSALYTSGPWRIIAWLGLLSLSLQCAYFFFMAKRDHSLQPHAESPHPRLDAAGNPDRPWVLRTR